MCTGPCHVTLKACRWKARKFVNLLQEQELRQNFSVSIKLCWASHLLSRSVKSMLHQCGECKEVNKHIFALNIGRKNPFSSSSPTSTVHGGKLLIGLQLAGPAQSPWLFFALALWALAALETKVCKHRHRYVREKKNIYYANMWECTQF